MTGAPIEVVPFGSNRTVRLYWQNVLICELNYDDDVRQWTKTNGGPTLPLGDWIDAASRAVTMPLPARLVGLLDGWEETTVSDPALNALEDK